MAVLSGCGQGGREGFIAGRVLDRCDTGWPVCDRVAGCLLGDQSYIEGKLPGSGLLAVQVFELSTVRLSFYLESVSAAGTETALSFFEDKCRSRIRQTITGRIFVGEAQKMGWVYREAELSGVGDHLIEFSSDTRADYLAKVEVIPKRIQTE
ncbi:MAG: hypothetical protein HYZ28_28125 [Myxococcales bacterium]|nr:hypothetical protein [Myxococcales bacterium]